MILHGFTSFSQTSFYSHVAMEYSQDIKPNDSMKENNVLKAFILQKRGLMEFITSL